jgi:hypothetical protein
LPCLLKVFPIPSCGSGREAIKFWEALSAITGFIFIMEADDFFPDISSLYENMGQNSGTPNANTGFSSTPYVSLFLFIKFVLQFLLLAMGLDMLDMFWPSRSLVNMVNLISMFLVTFCLLSLWIKYHGKVLIFPTI